MKDTDARKRRRDAAIDVADQLRDLISHPFVRRFFEVEEHKLTERMLSANVLDDETRRECAISIAALRRLKSALDAAVARGTDLAKRRDEDGTE